jgi:hypothetical protein
MAAGKQQKSGAQPMAAEHGSDMIYSVIHAVEVHKNLSYIVFADINFRQNNTLTIF